MIGWWSERNCGWETNTCKGIIKNDEKYEEERKIMYKAYKKKIATNNNVKESKKDKTKRQSKCKLIFVVMC